MIPDANIAVIYAKIAAAAYDTSLLPEGCKLIRTFEHEPTDTQAILVEYADRKILAIRGTSNWQDFHTDIKAGLVQFGSGRAHQGFVEATKGLIQALDGLDLQDLILVGHSLGGAIAALTSIIARIPAVTFGQPKVGDAALADRLWLLTRYVNEADGVPLLPYLPHYEHGGACFYITAAHNILVNPSLWDTVKARTEGLFDDLDMVPDTIGDHLIAAYVENLTRRMQ